MEVLSFKARATAPGSLRNLEDKLRGSINDAFRSEDPTTNKNDISSYPVDIIPDKPIKSGTVIVEDYSLNKYYSVPFSVDENGEYVLSEKTEVNKKIDYEATKSTVLAVEKAKDHVMFTGTALIPGEPDCDAENGEEILTAEKVAKIAHSFMDYRIVDKEHEFLVTKKNMGDPVESYLLDSPKTMKNIKGEEREYPAGTWVVKSKITDPEMMKAALKGEIAYSVSVLSEDDANKVMAANKDRVLIKDIPNPVGFTLSLTKNPCVDNSCSMKSANKAGAAISKQNKSVIEKARDMLNGLITQANSPNTVGGEKMTDEKKKNENPEETEYVKKSDMDKMVDEKVQEALKAAKEAAEAPKCPKCEATVKADDKFCSACGASLKKASKKSKEEGEQEEEEEEEETEEIKGSSKSLKPTGKENPKPAVKSFEEETGRDIYGRKL